MCFSAAMSCKFASAGVMSWLLCVLLLLDEIAPIFLGALGDVAAPDFAGPMHRCSAASARNQRRFHQIANIRGRIGKLLFEPLARARIHVAETIARRPLT